MSALASFLSNLFISPLYLWFLGLIPIVVLLYILKLRRTAVVIPSTMLWRKSLHDLTANAPFQRLRKNLLLFLQVLILLLAVLALARPFIQTEGVRGENLCLIIDHSASMSAKEEGGTRLELAKQRALDLIDTMESGDRTMVVSFAETAAVLCELTDDRRRLKSAVGAIAPTETRSNVRDAMLIVKSLAPDNPDVPSVAAGLEIFLISDGRITDLPELSALSKRVTYLRVGETARNAGIVAFQMRAPEEGEGVRQAFVLVHNADAQELKTTLTLYYEDAALAVEEITVPGQASTERVFSLPKLEEGLLRAELDLDDALEADNRAWLAVRPEAYLKVLLVSEPEAVGAYFLRRVLTLDPRVQASTMPPSDYADTGEYDLTIFNGAPPASAGDDGAGPLPSGSLLYVNAVPPLPGLAATGLLENPPVLAVEKDHPVMRFLNPGNVRISKAMKVDLPQGARSLMSTTGGPLVADVSRGDRQILMIGFDLADSNWPLHLSFPLFVQNLLSWLPRSSMTGETGAATGAPLEIMPVPEIDEAQITRPDGSREKVELDPLRPVFYGNTDTAGPYEVKLGEETRLFAVNLLDKNETAIAPAPSLNLGRAAVEAVEGPVRFNREFWWWLAAAALAVLCLEWWIYSRRAWL